MDGSNKKYYNRETSIPYSCDGDIIKEAKILSLSKINDKNNEPLDKGQLPEGAKLLAVGLTLDDFDVPALKSEKPNVVFVSHCCPESGKTLVQLLDAFPTIEWVHSRSAGVDYLQSKGLTAARHITVTNAKGCYSSTLAEYTVMACAYFAKDLPKLMRQKNNKDWNKYEVLEMRGATLGVVGYGDIGQAASRLAKAFGMKVIALRRNPTLSEGCSICDKVYGVNQLNTLMSESDYVLVAAPLTDETRGLISEEAIAHAKKDAVLINVGRGPIINEDAMIEALKSRKLKGAGLDVTTLEPLPKSSPLWDLDNVLLSPHNMDMTATFLRESTEFFVNENLKRFVHGEELLNPVDKAAGY